MARASEAPVGRQPWRSLLLVALPLAARSQVTTSDVASLISGNPGCFRKGFQYDAAIPNTNVATSSLAECQARCVKLNRCVVFAYWPFGGECWFGDSEANLVPSKTGAIAGYGVCPDPKALQATPACSTDFPRNGFPGLSRAAAHAAWPSGRQPWSLECWPHNDTGGLLPCKHAVVLEDTKHGWPGKCSGMREVKDGYSTCEERCRRDANCASWQLGVFGGCYHGMGSECYVRRDFAPLAAQRLQHGLVRVLMDLKGWQIFGLNRVFDNLEGYFQKLEDAVYACKAICYSDVECQYWTYAPKYGCWVEDVTQLFKPPYPLTLESAFRNTPFALDSVAGEYIQHYCPDTHTTTFAPLVLKTEGCMVQGMKYDPLGMPGQPSSTETSVSECQSRCRSTKRCAYFSYWPDGTCMLQENTANEQDARGEPVISGPANCGKWQGSQASEVRPSSPQRAASKPAGSEIVAVGQQRYTSALPRTAGSEYVPAGPAFQKVDDAATAPCDFICRRWPVLALLASLLAAGAFAGVFCTRRQKATRGMGTFGSDEEELSSPPAMWRTHMPWEGWTTRRPSSAAAAAGVYQTQPLSGFLGSQRRVQPRSGEFTV